MNTPLTSKLRGSTPHIEQTWRGWNRFEYVKDAQPVHHWEPCNGNRNAYSHQSCILYGKHAVTSIQNTIMLNTGAALANHSEHLAAKLINLCLNKKKTEGWMCLWLTDTILFVVAQGVWHLLSQVKTEPKMDKALLVEDFSLLYSKVVLHILKCGRGPVISLPPQNPLSLVLGWKQNFTKSRMKKYLKPIWV